MINESMTQRTTHSDKARTLRASTPRMVPRDRRAGRVRAPLTMLVAAMLLATTLYWAAPAGAEPAVGTSPAGSSAMATDPTPEPLPEDDVLRFPDDHPNFPGQIITGDEDPELALERPDGSQWSSSSGINVYSPQIKDPALLDAVEYGVCPQRDPDHPDYDPEYECPGGRPTVIRWLVEIDKYIDTNLGSNFCKLDTTGDPAYQSAFDVLADNGVKLDVQLWTSSWGGAMWGCGFKSSSGMFFSGTKGMAYYRSIVRHIYDLLLGSYGETLTDLVSFGAWNEPDFFNYPYYQSCMVVPRNMVNTSFGKWSGGSDPDPSNPYSQWAALHAVLDDHVSPEDLPDFNNSAAASTNWTRDWVNNLPGNNCPTSTSWFDADGVNHWVGDSLRNDHVAYLDLHRYFSAAPTAKRLAEYAIELLQLYDAKAEQINPEDPRYLPVFIGEVGVNAGTVWSAPAGTNEPCWASGELPGDEDTRAVDADDARELRKLHYFLSNYLGDRYMGATWHGGNPNVTLGWENSIWDPDYSTNYNNDRCPLADILVDGDSSEVVTVTQGTSVDFAINGRGTLSAGAQQVRWWFPGYGDYDYIVGDTTAFTFDQPGTYEVAVMAFDNSGPVDGGSSAAWDFDRVTVHVEGNGAPVAELSATPTSGQAPLTVAFDGSASTGDIAEYRWDFDGDGTADLSSTDPTAEHVYDTAGSYEASLTVVDTEGLESAPATELIEVAPAEIDHVKVVYSNQLSYTNDNDVISGDVNVSTSSVSGSVTVPSATAQPGQTASITFALQKKSFFSTTYWSGAVYVNDSPAGFAITTTFPFGKQVYVDGSTATASLYGLIDTRSLPWRTYNFTMEVVDGA